MDDCLADGNIPEACEATTEQLADSNPNDAEKLPDGAPTVDLLPHVCPTGANSDSDICSAMGGNVVAWYDGSHLTNRSWPP